MDKMNPSLQAVVNLLEYDIGSLKNAIEYCTAGTLPTSVFKIEVKGMGKLNFPLKKSDLKKMIKITESAKPKDSKVKLSTFPNFHELPLEKFTIKFDENTLNKHFQNVIKTLGLPESTVLVPHLQKLVVYGPGQFSYRHQVRARQENIIATMVAVIPATPITGNFMVRFNEKERTFPSQNEDNSLINTFIFYTDCLHGLKQLTDGYHVLLTYCLALKTTSSLETFNIDYKLRLAVKEYFLSKIGPDKKAPIKLVYRLQHSYTEKSLVWGLLKGPDRIVGAAFLAVARELCLIPNLCLIESEKICSSLKKEYWQTFKQKHWFKRRTLNGRHVIPKNVLPVEEWSEHQFKNKDNEYNFVFINPKQFLFFCENNYDINRLFEKLPITEDERCWTTESTFNPTKLRMYEIYKTAAVVLWATP